MYYLAIVLPFAPRFGRLPFSRDQAMLFMVAFNEIFLGIEHYFAHIISGTIRPHEMIPIIFGPTAGVLLFLVMLIIFRWRGFASVFGTIVLVASIVVGILGWFFHFMRAILPAAPAGERFSMQLLIWAPPILGPLTASLVGLLGILAVWPEDPSDSGVFRLLGNRRIAFPISKARAYFMLVGLGALATLISSVLDHARTGFENPWLWVPVVVGVFGSVVGVTVGIFEKPSRGDLITFTVAMLFMIAVGVLGAGLHIWNDYLLGAREIVPERFIRGAPFLAPLLFTDIGTLGLVVLLDPGE